MGLRICILVALGASLLPCLAQAQTYSKTETIEYSDNLGSWVLGQVKRTTTNGAEVSRTDYDNDTALPMAAYSFGQLQQAMTYNADGTVATVADGKGNVIHLGNYKRGMPQLIQFPATTDQPSGTSMSAVVDDQGLIRSVVDARGAKTCYDYDAMGRVTKVQYPSETSVGQCGGTWNDTLSSFSSGYPAADGLPAGHWRQRVTTGNLLTETLFDALWRPVVKQTYDLTNVNATINQMVTRYDANGNVSFQSYPQSTTNTAVTSTWADPTKTPNALGADSTYDALNRVTSVTQDAESEVGPVKTVTQYLSGFKVQVTDPNTKVTTMAFMAFDEPTTDWPVQIDAPEDVHQTIVRDAFGKPTSITQYGEYGTESKTLQKTFAYDAHQRLCLMTEPESGGMATTYDNAGNVLGTASGLAVSDPAVCAPIPAGSQTTYSYDAMNRLKTIAPPAGTQNTLYTYSPTSSVVKSESGITTWQNQYNYRGALVSEALQVLGDDNRTLSYGYDANGSLSQATYPNGEVVAYAPDARGRPTRAGSYASSVHYFPNGQVSDFLFGNGTTYAADQNSRQLASNFTYEHGATFNLSEDLHYDKVGNIARVVDLADGPRTKTFQYDGLNRLTYAVAPGLWGTESYTYDPLNNLRTRLSAGQTSVYEYEATTNLLHDITRGGVVAASFAYDPRGNTITRNGATLQFDQKNQLLQVQGYDSYQYDASGRRVRKTPANGGASALYLYDGAGQLMYQYAPTQSQATNFIYLGTRLIADNASLMLSQPGAVIFAPNPNNGDYTVSWGAVAQATSYILQERGAGGSAWTTVYSGSATTKAFSGREGGGYVYQVQANAMDGTQPVHSGWTTSETLGVTPKTPSVSGPTTLVFGPYTVSWTASVGISGYDVQESLDGGAWATIASDTTATSIVRPGMVGGNYTYRVMAKNAYGNRGWSASIAVAVTQVPDVPTDFVPVTGTDGTYVQLTWDAMRFATSYELTQYRTGIHLGFQTFLLSNNSYDVPHLAPNEVIFELKACSIAGCSAPIRIGGNPFLTPTVPTVTAPSTLVFGTYTVSWTASPGATAYDVEEKVGDGGWVNIASHTAATSITRPGTAGGSYQYQVSAWNNFGSRGWSIPATVAVTQVPDKPTNFIFTTDEYGDSILSWDAMPFATSYQLTVNGINGSLGTYIYNVGDPSFVVPEGNYQVSRLAACSIAGCSVAVQVSGHGGGFGDTAAKGGKAKPRRMESGAPMAPSGCTATSCQAVIGGAP